MKTALFAIAVLGLLLLAGCTSLDSVIGSGTSNSGSGGSYASGAMPKELPLRATADFAAASAPSDVVQAQQLIKTANAELEVPAGTLQARYAQFKGLISSDGGQILSADYQETDNTKEYNIRAKIPPAKFEGLASQLQGIGSVKQMNSNVEDVSSQYVDLTTRIKNLQIQRDDLRNLFAQNGSLEDVLAVERELIRVQTDIEMYQNEQLNMDRQIAMSGVQVRIYEQAPAVDRNVLAPLADVGNIFLGALGAAILVLSAILGFGIPVLIVLFIAYKIFRHLRPKKEAASAKTGKK